MIKVLHISDLHVTSPYESLEEIWIPPRAHMKKKEFSFIVVSGDLTQAAEPDEYDRLLDFANKSLLPLLSRREKHRIIFVPGNHDVSWKATIGRPFSVSTYLEQNEPLSWSKLLQVTRYSPRNSKLRLHVSRFGHLEFLEIAKESYAARFENVQRFLNEFYGGSLSGKSRPFNLKHEAEGEDWSAHVFEDERVAFYGFNSCHRNDKHWTGAAINPISIHKARQHAEQLPPELIRVAVWHHGLKGEQSRPDYLEHTDIGSIHSAGFRIGFHGHTHRASNEVLENVFKDRFALISTGSLGAGAPERPDAVGNQFSKVHIYPGQVKVDVFEREGLYGVYPAEPTRRQLFLLRPTERQKERPTRAGRHTRTYSIDNEGMAEVEVTLEDLELNGPLILAMLSPPFCAERPDDTATSEHGMIRVHSEQLPDGRVRYSIHGESLPIKKLTWRYRVSNAYPLTDTDHRVFSESQSQWLPRLHPGMHARPHHVRFPCDVLEIVLRYESPAIDTKRSVAVIAEFERDEDGQKNWRRDPTEEKRCKPKPAQSSELSFEIEAPLVGYRYALGYHLREKGDAPTNKSIDFATELLDLLRNGSDANSDEARELLTRFVNKGFASVLEEFVKVRPGEAQATSELVHTWVAYLWDDTQKRLLPCFGRFPPRIWGTRFARGSGVVGHAFRFSRAASWRKREHSQLETLIYQPTPEFHPWRSEHEWVIAIPLLLGRGERGPSIGVIGISNDKARDSAVEDLFRGYANSAYSQKARDVKRVARLSNMLTQDINHSFWIGIKKLSQQRSAKSRPTWRELAGSILAKFQLPETP
ncbi:MAG TPA: metallophosphoesterase [Myxococcaceae bacterium]|nr:metallophosphoesterase [Myxococcaceae bacterium]